jgi:hypothetical protein
MTPHAPHPHAHAAVLEPDEQAPSQLSESSLPTRQYTMAGLPSRQNTLTATPPLPEQLDSYDDFVGVITDVTSSGIYLSLPSGFATPHRKEQAALAWALVLAADATEPLPLTLDNATDAVAGVELPAGTTAYLLDDCLTEPLLRDTLETLFVTHGVGTNPFTRQAVDRVIKVTVVAQ